MAEATTTDSAHAKDAHHHGTKNYFVVWIILLACTGLTVWTGHKDLSSVFPSANITIALIIATIKASLVIWYFMHMREAAGTNRIVFVTSFVFLLVMVFGVFGDLWTRSQMTLPSAVPSTEGPEIQVPEGSAPPAHHE